ncbi:MAG TPA: energy transducer TonB [Candidatus Dormibacteraeota bacterium]|nr:energy transducer TonB [Candidatus Dormibacteraeota bacterium]
MLRWTAALGVVCSMLLVPHAQAASLEPAVIEPSKTGDPGTAHAFVDRSGVLETRDGLTLRLTTDLGSVRILSLDATTAPVVRYTVRIETDIRAPLAQRLLDNYALRANANSRGVEINGTLPSLNARGSAPGAQFWVQFEVTVPRGYNVEVKTGAGDIETQDVGGAANLFTMGGNIRTGRIGVAGVRLPSSGHVLAKLETQGGHIQVTDVAGDLNAITGGGHINVGNIVGSASLRSGGGHIRAAQIGGRSELETDGGNITVGHAESYVNVRTGGGQIDFGEVRGSVHAQTGGGGIRIMYVSGPMEVESSAGSICLTRVAGAVRAATAGGSITAWINPDAPAGGGPVRLDGVSQLASGNGDIVVFLPRNLAANIEAIVATGGEHRIEADPALHLAIQMVQANGADSVHATGALNGGGAPLRLRTAAGKIRLQFLDSEPSLRESRIREQQERLRVVEPVEPTPVLMEGATPEAKTDWLESWIDRFEVALTGGLREDTEDFQKRLVFSPHPSYPALAQRAGIQGIVRLQVRATKDGRIEVQKLLEGEPVLADAAIVAVKQWRAKPAWIKGKQIEVVSTVSFNFQLH